MKLWNIKTILKASLIAVIAGIVLAAAGFSMGAEYRGLYWDRGPRIIRLEDVTEIREDIPAVQNIRIDAAFGDVEFVSADRYAIALTGIKDEWEWSVNGDALEITQRVRQQIGFFTFSTFASTARKVTVYLPQNAELRDVNIIASSGDIKAGGFRAQSTVIDSGFGSVSLQDMSSDILEMYMDSGDLDCTNTTAGSLTCDASFGSGLFKNVTVNSFTAAFDSGDITCTDSVLGHTDLQLNFGSFTGQAVSTDGLTLDADSGDIEISGELLGETVITANFGSVDLNPASSAVTYALELETDFGEVRYDGRDMGSRYLIENADAPNSLDVQCDSGDIEVRFTS